MRSVDVIIVGASLAAAAAAKRLVDAGNSEDAIVAANPLADYHDDWNWGFITTERMTETLIKHFQAN